MVVAVDPVMQFCIGQQNQAMCDSLMRAMLLKPPWLLVVDKSARVHAEKPSPQKQTVRGLYPGGTLPAWKNNTPVSLCLSIGGTPHGGPMRGHYPFCGACRGFFRTSTHGGPMRRHPTYLWWQVPSPIGETSTPHGGQIKVRRPLRRLCVVGYLLTLHQIDAQSKSIAAKKSGSFFARQCGQVIRGFLLPFHAGSYKAGVKALG